MRAWHTRIVRDTAEVVAIILAGAWALYVFVFQNVIVPETTPPTPVVTVTMKHVGNDGPLAVVQIDEVFKNPGATTVVFMAWATTVFGMKVVPETTPQRASGSDIENELQAYYRLSNPVVVFRDAHITYRGNGHSPYGLWLNPGQVSEISREFFVPRARFPFLAAHIVNVYSKDTSHVIPTTLTIESSGLARPQTVVPDTAIQSNVVAAELDLAAQ
ncbi:MAG TPA: hypothetical protein VMA98_09190 [Candidatus Acidoferrales bacterium]|nr:hypothetical protein [Candidatus Acidoferrales bacterium]